MICTVCDSADVMEIDAALASGESVRKIEARYQLNRNALHRHRHNCRHKVRRSEAAAIREELALDPAKITEAVAPLRAEAVAQRPNADELLTLAAYLIAVAAQRALALADPASMLSVAREARETAAFDIKTAPQREHLQPPSRHRSPVAMLDDIYASLPDVEAKALLRQMPARSKRPGGGPSTK